MYNMKHIGEEYETYQGYTAKIVDGGSKERYCTIEIDGRQWEVLFNALKRGRVKNPWYPSVWGVGYVGTSESDMKVKNQQAYACWLRMLRRCYDIKTQTGQPIEVGRTVAKEWHSFYNFLQWYKDNVTPDTSRIKCQLDNDLLSHGNSKCYGPDTCILTK